MSLQAGQEKWNRKTKAAFQQKWVKSFSNASTFDAWAQGLSAATGIPVNTIAQSLPAQNFRAAQQNPQAYLEKAMRKIDAAAASNKWSTNFVRAFQ